MRSSISKLKSQGLGPEDVRVEGKGLVGAAARRAKTVVEIYRNYQRRLVQNNAMDFDDIILVALRLLRQNTGPSVCVCVSCCCCCCCCHDSVGVALVGVDSTHGTFL